VQLSGKNTTNLKTHLSRFHKEEFQLVETQDAEKEEASSNVSSCKRVMLDTPPKQATLMASGVFRGGGGGGATAVPLWRGLCWRRSGAAPPFAVTRGAVGGGWLGFSAGLRVKWKKCEK
jgi:hypothetical protein